MEKNSTFARYLPSLEKRAATEEPATWESYAADRCARAGEESDDPGVWVLRSDWGREHPGLAARRVVAIEWVGREEDLRVLLRSRVGPERACELALEGSKLSAAEVVREDFDPRDKEYDDFKTREMEGEERYW